MTATYRVSAIRYGALRAPAAELFHGTGGGGEREMAYFFWLLEGGDGPILVDSGFKPAVGTRRGRTCLVKPPAALAALGIDPGDVSTIVVTHFHYDHIGCLDRYPEAQLIVPRLELEFWTGPMAARPAFASHVEPAEVEYLRQAAAEGRVRTTDGEEEILPGVRAISVGGHSPGQQLTVVETGEAPVLLTSDAVHFYEELEHGNPFGVFVDLQAVYRGYDRVIEIAEREGATIVPGHDPLVLERFPALQGDGFAVRVEREAP